MNMNKFYLINICMILLLQLVHQILAGDGLTAYSFLFGGMDADSTIEYMNFQPDDGLKFRKKYEAKHGPRGQYLIEKLGKGYSNEGPTLLDPDQTITKPPKNKSKRYGSKHRKNSPVTITETITQEMSTPEATTSDATGTYDSTTYYDSTTDLYDSTTAESINYDYSR